MKVKVLLFILGVLISSSINGQKIESKKTLGENKFYQNGQKLSTKQLKVILKDNTEALNLMKSAKTNQTWATILGGAGGVLVGLPLGTAIVGGDAKWELAGVGAVLILGSIPILNSYNKKSKKSIELYNSDFPNVSSNFQPKFNVSYKVTSLGITMNF